MITLILWVVLVVVQIEPGVVETVMGYYDSKAECEMDVKQVKQYVEVLQASECVPVTLYTVSK